MVHPYPPSQAAAGVQQQQPAPPPQAAAGVRPDDYQTRLHQTGVPYSHGITTNNQQQNFMETPLIQSPNGSTNTYCMPFYLTSDQQYRQNRPMHMSNIDEQITSIENDPNSLTSTQQQDNWDNFFLTGPPQE